MTTARSRYSMGVAISAIFFLMPAMAHAVGVGAYFEYGHGIGYVHDLGQNFDYDDNRYV